MTIEIFGFSMKRFKERLADIIEKNKKEEPRLCMEASNKSSIDIDSDEYIKITDDIMTSANAENSEYQRDERTKYAVEIYRTLNSWEYEIGERRGICDKFDQWGSQSALKKTSKVLNFKYIPRGFWDKAWTGIFN